MEVTLEGHCPHCRRHIKLHEHVPAELPRPGDVIRCDGNLGVVTGVVLLSGMKCATVYWEELKEQGK